jgi:D-alanyl-D-alanine carboxypeptidase
MLATKMMLVAVGLATAWLASAPATGEVRHFGTATPALERLSDRLVRDGAPGALVFVRTPSGLQHAESGVARRHPRLALTADDRFRVASLTKTFVATVVLQLVAERRLRLDDSVQRLLPGLVPPGGTITVRQLLGHTSGLFDYFDDERFVRAVLAQPGRVWSPRTLVGIATRHRPLFPPGRGWHYSNTDYVLLGLVAEAIGRSSIAEQLARRIFGPLHLSHTSFPTGRAIAGAHAHGYVGFATLPQLHSLRDATTAVSPSYAWAAGAIVSTAADISTFYASLLGGRLLPKPLLNAMKSPHGLGLQEVDTRCGRAYGHDGVGVGYRSVVYARGDGTRVAVAMINLDETYVSQRELDDAAEAAFCAA